MKPRTKLSLSLLVVVAALVFSLSPSQRRAGAKEASIALGEAAARPSVGVPAALVSPQGTPPPLEADPAEQAGDTGSASVDHSWCPLPRGIAIRPGTLAVATAVSKNGLPIRTEIEVGGGGLYLPDYTLISQMLAGRAEGDGIDFDSSIDITMEGEDARYDLTARVGEGGCLVVGVDAKGYPASRVSCSINLSEQPERVEFRYKPSPTRGEAARGEYRDGVLTIQGPDSGHGELVIQYPAERLGFTHSVAVFWEDGWCDDVDVPKLHAVDIDIVPYDSSREYYLDVCGMARRIREPNITLVIPDDRLPCHVVGLYEEGLIRVESERALVVGGDDAISLRFPDDVGGIGIAVSSAAGGMRVDRILAGGGADSSGLRVGDLITHVDTISTHDMAVSEFRRLVVGAVGTHVSLDVVSEGRDHALKVERDYVDPALP